jgi:ribosomal protein S12 methylthiotransferase accessory factor
MTTETLIPGKDASLETTIATMQAKLQACGFHLEEKSWLNPVDGIWSVHVRDRDCPILFTNGKGATRLACLASALGEFFERLSTNYFWTHFYLGPDVAERKHVHYPQEKWFVPAADGKWPNGLLNAELMKFYNPENSIDAFSLVEFNSGNVERGICAIPIPGCVTTARPISPSTSLVICTSATGCRQATPRPRRAPKRCRKSLSAM